MKSEVMTITPELARFWLGQNQGNRSISQRTVNQYAKDMESGNWHITNQGIGFYKDGRLADGQHRLHAIIKANKPVTMLVVRDLDDDAIDGIDINRVRSLADIMTLKNGSVSTNEIAALRLAYGMTGDKISPAQMQLMVEQSLGDLRAIMGLFMGCNQSLRKTTLFAGLLMAKNAGISLDKINDFVQVLKTGVFHDDGEQSAFLLRDKYYRVILIMVEVRYAFDN